MPRYESVPDKPQLPTASRPKAETPSRMEKPQLVPITASIPIEVRKQLRIACAVHGIKMQDAIAEALQDWVVSHSDPGD